jgi:hypothetical protein
VFDVDLEFHDNRPFAAPFPRSGSWIPVAIDWSDWRK